MDCLIPFSDYLVISEFEDFRELYSVKDLFVPNSVPHVLMCLSLPTGE